MPLDGNFEDYVVLSQDTLSHRGAQLGVGTITASTVTLGMSNSAGALALAASATGNATVWLPSAGGTLLSNVNVSASNGSANLSAVVFSNSNGVSFGLSGSTLTMSAGAGASVNLSAGTTSNLGSAFTFSNSNSVSFGLNAGTVTASVSGLASLNVSAGTTSQNLSAFTLSNDNVDNGGFLFGLSGSTVTASMNVHLPVTFVVSAGGQSADYGLIALSNSNSVTFGMSGSSQMTASTFTQAGQITAVNLSAGTTSLNLPAVTFLNSNHVSFGLNASTLTAQAAVNLSAGTTSGNLTAVTFSNSNGVSFGLNGSTLTASAGVGVSAGAASNALSNLVLSNSNGISFGLNGSVVTAGNGGVSSWQNGNAFNSFVVSNLDNLSLLPAVVDYAITVTNFVNILSISGVTNSSGHISFKYFIYTLANSTLLSAVSTTISNLTWTSGGAYSSVSGANYHGVTVASWAFTPGPYVFGVGLINGTIDSVSATVYGIMSNVSIPQNLTLVLPGYVTGSVAASISVNVQSTAQYVRNGGSVLNQPWFVMQGT